MSTTPAIGIDTGISEHYGDPLREQRSLSEGVGVIDRGHRGVLRISGKDRLTWLHTLTTQHVEQLSPHESTQALILDAKGHIEHHLLLVDDGETVWITVEPGTQTTLLEYLERMRFLLDVHPEDVTEHYAAHTVVGPEAPKALEKLDGDVARISLPLLGEIPMSEMIFPRNAQTDLPYAGVAAFEALRVAALSPRLGVDTDHRSLPHELGWIGTAVHLDKGCYRGQETVAKIHNLGQRPRRKVLLHLDGFTEELPASGTLLMLGEKKVGYLGTAVHHYELGHIALGVVKRNIEDGAELRVADADITARVEDGA